MLKSEYTAFSIIVFIFFVLASAGIFFGFGMESAVGDEPVLTSATLKMIGEPQLTPADSFNYHMPLTPYLYAPFFVVVMGALLFFGVFASVQDLVAFGIVEWGQFIIIGRFISVLLGVGTLYLFWRLTKHILGGTWIPLLAVYLLATHLLFIMMGHFAKIWMPQMFFLMLAWLCIARFFQKENLALRDYALVGLSAALSFGIHFIGILVFVPFLVVHWLRERHNKWRDILLHRGLLLSGGIVLLSAPLWYLLNPHGVGNYASRALSSLGILGGGAPAADVATVTFIEKTTFYLLVLWEYEPLVTLLFIPAMVFFFLRRRDWFWIIISFMAAYYLVIGPLVGGSGLKLEPRFVLPLVPFVALVVAFGVGLWAQYERGRVLFFSVLTLLIVTAPIGSIMWDYKLFAPYTPEVTHDWIESRLPTGSTILFIDYGEPLKLNENKATLEHIHDNAPGFYTRARAYLLAHDSYRNGREPQYRILHTSYLQEHENILQFQLRPDYVVVSWDKAEKRMFVEKDIAKFAPGLLQKRPLVTFPEGATVKSVGYNIGAHIRVPIRHLSTDTDLGPVYMIYEW